MEVDSDIDVEEDMPFAGPSRKYFLMKPWSLCLSSRNMENRDNKCYERALRLVHDLHFWELLVKGNSISIHKKNLQTLVKETFKTKQGISSKTCAWKPKVPGSSSAASYVQRWALSNNRPANV